MVTTTLYSHLTSVF